ncbi:hypothetical protein WV31_18980 [Magnetospirillum sp. ME-1]|uniref:DUF4160 domain-containing protein n=1 Tax=Paramagnetospirillum magneticum (strain ATCC 700264 / AMB-1) TaxID=342108 RepID=Q2W8I2_PARM1|nr:MULTISPECIES: hypothetical protein [Rhodospirillales]ARJ67589.1 hypothetical protein WV31_18980 [Magnetospirillum sp. ME-1]BAE49843.1 hypothetical protein amb1039 [Paramagnetospirillum magneticum AMB-1]
MKLFHSAGANARVDIQTEDHCPPHVHALNWADRWEAKVEISFVDNNVVLMEVLPVANEPTRRTLGKLLDEVGQHLDLCRRGWWRIYGDTCLVNRWIRVSAEGVPAVLKKGRKGASQVLGAKYDPGSTVLTLAMSDGSTVSINAGDGEVER